MQSETKRLIGENIVLLEKMDLQGNTLQKLKQLSEQLEKDNAKLTSDLSEKNSEIMNLKQQIKQDNEKSGVPFTRQKPNLFSVSP